MAEIPLTGNAFHKSEMEYHGKFGHTLGRIQHISPMIRIEIFIQLVVQQPKIWHLLFLVSKVSSSVLNICVVTHKNQYFNLLVIMVAQMLSYLREVGIKLKTTQPRLFKNTIKMWIILAFSTEDSQFQVLFILSLELMYAVKYRFNQLQPLTPLMEKLDTCTRITKKIRLSGDTWRPWHSTLVHQQYIRKISQVLFLLMNIEDLLPELNTFTFLFVFYKKKLTMFFLFQKMISLVVCQPICAPNHVQVQLSARVLHGLLN